MTVLRIYLVALFAGLAAYTLVVGAQQGWDLVPVFVSNVTRLTWSGQFNLDFMSYVSISAIWIAWRHQFRAAGIVMGAIAFFGGILVFAPYLVWASVKAGGDTLVFLLGKDRATRLLPDRVTGNPHPALP